MKKQIVVIHGGNTFETKEEYLEGLRKLNIEFDDFVNPKAGWKANIQTKLNPDFDVILPKMPNWLNAQFDEWKIYFEKFIPFLSDGVILIGHSLGGAFLVKYLAEEKFPKKIRALMLVAACFGDNLPEYKAGSFLVPKNLNNVSNQISTIIIYHSKDDKVVPFSDLEKFKQVLPKAKVRIFEDRGHFNQEEFPEIVEDIKTLK